MRLWLCQWAQVLRACTPQAFFKILPSSKRAPGFHSEPRHHLSLIMAEHHLGAVSVDMVFQRSEAQLLNGFEHHQTGEEAFSLSGRTMAVVHGGESLHGYAAQRVASRNCLVGHVCEARRQQKKAGSTIPIAQSDGFTLYAKDTAFACITGPTLKGVIQKTVTKSLPFAWLYFACTLPYTCLCLSFGCGRLSLCPYITHWPTQN